jgi:hypothetical protein
MGKSKGGPPPTQQVESRTYQSRLPEYAAPFYKNLVGRAQALSYEDYIPYEAPRVAGFSPESIGAQEGIKALASRDLPGIAQARNIAGVAATAGPLMAGSQYGGTNVQSRFGGMPIRNQYQAGPIRSTYAAAPIRSGVQGFGPEAYMRASKGFDDRSAQRYMNPYLSNVLDRQQQRATDRFGEQRAQRNQQAIQAGAFGGSRQGVQDAIAQRELNESLQDIEAKGLSTAFTQAQQQFERDRAARFQGLTSADAGQLALAKQRTSEQMATEDAKRQAADQNLRAQIAQQNALQAAGGQSLKAQIATMQGLSDADKRSLEAQIATGRFSQEAGAQDLQAQLANQKAMEAAYGRGLKGSQLLAGLDKSEQALDLQRLKALSDVGGQRQALMQRAYDQQYEDFLAQREYPYQQLERYSALLQGMPAQPSFSERRFGQAANPTAQLLNTGLGAYGAFRGMGGGG